MNFAHISRASFVTRKPVETKQTISEHRRYVMQFCDTHTISVSVDPSTGKGIVKVTKDEQDQPEQT